MTVYCFQIQADIDLELAWEELAEGPFDLLYSSEDLTEGKEIYILMLRSTKRKSIFRKNSLLSRRLQKHPLWKLIGRSNRRTMDSTFEKVVSISM